MNPRRKRCEGAALIESCIVIILLCLILFGILQISLVTAAYDVNLYAASCAARSAAVGYRDERQEDMANKVFNVAALPTLGPKPGMSISVERHVAKSYLLTDQGEELLSYVPDAYWNSLPNPVQINRSGGMVVVTMDDESYPLTIPFVRAFYPDDEVDLFPDDLQISMLDHAELYFEN